MKTKKRAAMRRPVRPAPALRFTPFAWAKFHWLCHRGPSEIGAFGISHPEDLLLITDVMLVEQEASVAGICFADEAVADFFDDQVDHGLAPEQFARIWLHTHPGDSPTPSSVDEETFQRVFGSCHWAVMAILARGGRTYARLRFNLGPGGEQEIPVRIDYEQPFPGSAQAVWEESYQRQVKIRRERRLSPLFEEQECFGGDDFEVDSDEDDWREESELELMTDSAWSALWENDDD